MFPNKRKPQSTCLSNVLILNLFAQHVAGIIETLTYAAAFSDKTLLNVELVQNNCWYATALKRKTMTPKHARPQRDASMHWGRQMSRTNCTWTLRTRTHHQCQMPTSMLKLDARWKWLVHITICWRIGPLLQPTTDGTQQDSPSKRSAAPMRTSSNLDRVMTTVSETESAIFWHIFHHFAGLAHFFLAMVLTLFSGLPARTCGSPAPPPSMKMSFLDQQSNFTTNSKLRHTQNKSDDGLGTYDASQKWFAWNP